jgi:hypothetical protein
VLGDGVYRFHRLHKVNAVSLYVLLFKLFCLSALFERVLSLNSHFFPKSTISTTGDVEQSATCDPYETKTLAVIRQIDRRKGFSAKWTTSVSTKDADKSFLQAMVAADAARAHRELTALQAANLDVDSLPLSTLVDECGKIGVGFVDAAFLPAEKGCVYPVRVRSVELTH